MIRSVAGHSGTADGETALPPGARGLAACDAGVTDTLTSAERARCPCPC